MTVQSAVFCYLFIHLDMTGRRFTRTSQADIHTYFATDQLMATFEASRAANV